MVEKDYVKKVSKYLVELVGDRIVETLPVIKCRQDGSFTLILPKLYNRLIVLNPTATEIYKLCLEKKTVREIVGKMCELYSDVDYEVIAGDVLRVLRDFEKKSLCVLKRRRT